MIIQVLGTGCPKCQTLERNVREAVSRLGLSVSVEKVSEVDRIIEMGVMMTPALAIDGVVKRTGKVLSVEEVLELLK